MLQKWRINQRRYLTLVIVICMGTILAGGIYYVSSLRKDLTNQAIQNVLTVTQQQQQAFDNFISGDRERLHSFAEYFAQDNSDDSKRICEQLAVFGKVNAIYTVIDLDTGQFYNNKSHKSYQMEDDELAYFRGLTDSGVREPYISLYTDDTMFGYYECFTFADGAQGVIQKSYECSKISDEFSLSFYNNQGFAYVVNRKGDILLRSNGMLGDHLYENIMDVLIDTHGEQKNIGRFMDALTVKETGSMVLAGDTGAFVYTYVPVKNVDEWYIVSIVPQSAISEEADEILENSQMSFGLLILLMVICTVFVLLIWRTNKDIQAKEQKIKYQEQLFDILSTYLSNNTDDVYLMLNQMEGRIEYISPNVERVFGIPADQFASRLDSFGSSECALSKTISMEALQKLEAGTSLEALETEWINPGTGEHKWFRLNIYCTLVQDKKKIVVYISDRTREREDQKNLSEALSLAKMASEAKSSFLSSVSHDIRTPMNAIIGLVALLREESDKPEVVLEYTQRIDAASQHLLGLINDVLDMNKIESGSASLNLSEMSMADVIDEINTIIRPQAKAKDQSFEIFVSSLVYEHLQGDKLRINQILINLLSNAVKYTPNGGVIEMRVEELPQVMDKYSRIQFVISDNGIGMSEDYRKIIFDPFTREETSAIRQIQGTGLGMAITKSLVELMGGTIKVESEPGKGSTFTVELELYIQEKEDDPKFWEEHRVAKMIVADDEEEVCLGIVKTMKQTGIITDYATDGKTAVKMMRTAREEGHPYDLILLDWKMPDLNGLETARLIRENYSRKIPILLLTAYDWGEIEQEAREIGVNHFMPKPFFMSTFKEAIRRCMGDMKEHNKLKDNVIQGMNILVVDDIEVNRMILVKIFQTLGGNCDVAGNGQDAVEMFEKSKPGEYDMILMDVQMPVMDGYTATKTIRASSHPSAKTIPIIAMTANAFVDDVRDAIDSGMDAHIAKPVQVDKLKATIHQVLDHRGGV